MSYPLGLLSAMSTRRRMASERFGLSGCLRRHLSTLAMKSPVATSCRRGDGPSDMRIHMTHTIGLVQPLANGVHGEYTSGRGIEGLIPDGRQD